MDEQILQKIKELSPNKRRLLEQRLRAQGLSISVQNTIPKRPDQAKAKLGSSQERLWLSQQLNPESSDYHMTVSLHITGFLNVEALRQSFVEISKRHETLRTTFPNKHGIPQQRIHTAPLLDWADHDISSLPLNEHINQAQKIVRKTTQTPFDLEQGPLWRIALIRRSDTDFVFTFVIHHLVFDGTSFGILYREIASDYEIFSLGKTNSSKKSIVQYADYAEWQHLPIQKRSLERQSFYWQQKLSNLQPLCLPTDFSLPQQMHHNGRWISRRIARPTFNAIKDLADQVGCTPFVVLLSSLFVVLARYTSQEIIGVFTHTANRDKPEIENTMGNFVNTLMITSQINWSDSFRALLHQVHNTVLEAHMNKDYPFACTLDCLSKIASSQKMLLHQLCFNMRNPDNGQFQLPGLHVEHFPYCKHTSTKFDLSIEAEITGHEIQIVTLYRTSVFSEETIQGMLQHYETLLEALVANPEQPLSAHTLYPQKTSDNTLQLPLEPRIPAQNQQTVWEQIKKHVQKTPKNTAIKTPSFTWTYEDLNNHVNRIASALTAICDIEHLQIALILPTIHQQIIVTLAALKVGAKIAWLPTKSSLKDLVDWPSKLQTFTIVTDSVHRVSVQKIAGPNRQVIDIDDLDRSHSETRFQLNDATRAELWLLESQEKLPPSISRYSQTQLNYHLQNYIKATELKSGDCILCLLPSGPEITIVSVFSALVQGASCVLDRIDRKVHSLGQRVSHQRISILHTHPHHYRDLFIQDAKQTFLAHIRLVVLSGSPVLLSDVELHQKNFSNTCHFMSAYQRRDFLWVSHYLRSRNSSLPHLVLPIGQGTEEHEILLLGKQGDIADITGEVAIGQLSPRPTTALLRTGQYGRRLPTGDIVILGPIKNSKVNSNRPIWLGEIEANLLMHSAIRQCVVDRVESVNGMQQLVAYIVTNESISSLCLKRFLKKRLIDYLIPKHYVMCTSLPRTSDGTVERQILQQLAHKKHISQANLQPQTVEEKTIAAIWMQLLEITNVTRLDNFLDLGGNSLQIVKMTKKIQEQLQIKTGFKDILTQNLSTLAADCVRKRNQLSPSISIRNLHSG